MCLLISEIHFIVKEKKKNEHVWVMLRKRSRVMKLIHGNSVIVFCQDNFREY